jgi:hypothetical protein
MRRRDFITVLRPAVCPLIAHARQPAAPDIGFLNSQTQEVARVATHCVIRI